MNARNEQYADYQVSLSTEPSYYGSECTREDAERIVKALGGLIRAEFPGIEIREWYDGSGSAATTGPDDAIVDDINRWISENWTSAL